VCQTAVISPPCAGNAPILGAARPRDNHPADRETGRHPLEGGRRWVIVTSIPDMIEANRANWDARVPVHLRGYGLHHLRRGGRRLADFEYAAIDVHGCDVLHLQCHIGTDTVCLARHGARAVGLDLSGASIDAARELAAECGVSVEYVQSDVYAAVEALGGRRFDVVYTGKGALCWLPDLHRWARVVADLLRPGGVLYAIDFHPLLLAAADEQPAHGLLLSGNYLGAGPERYDSAVTYAGAGRLVESTVSYEWAHGLDEVLDAVLSASLRLTRFVEHDVSCWPRFPGMTELADGWYGRPDGAPRLPLMFSVRAERD
jgi:SAM-dependent methyltransferase